MWQSRDFERREICGWMSQTLIIVKIYRCFLSARHSRKHFQFITFSVSPWLCEASPVFPSLLQLRNLKLKLSFVSGQQDSKKKRSRFEPALLPRGLGRAPESGSHQPPQTHTVQEVPSDQVGQYPVPTTVIFDSFSSSLGSLSWPYLSHVAP